MRINQVAYDAHIGGCRCRRGVIVDAETSSGALAVDGPLQDSAGSDASRVGENLAHLAILESAPATLK